MAGLAPGGGHHAAIPGHSADDHRLADQIRTVQPLHGYKEGVEIDMYDGLLHGKQKLAYSRWKIEAASRHPEDEPCPWLSALGLKLFTIIRHRLIHKLKHMIVIVFYLKLIEEGEILFPECLLVPVPALWLRRAR